MRKTVELVLLVLLVGAGGCGSQEAKPGTEARALERDLTLQTPTVPVAAAVASPAELARPAAQRPRAAKKAPQHPRPIPLSRPAARPEVTAVPEPAPTPAPEPAAQPVSQPVVDVVVTSGAGRELAPGETVTIIPAAAGPSTSEGDEIDLPVQPARGGIFVGRGGGTCRPRGGGVRGFRLTIR